MQGPRFEPRYGYRRTLPACFLVVIAARWVAGDARPSPVVTLPTQCICEFWRSSHNIQRVAYSPKQHEKTGICNNDAMCSPSGRKWGFSEAATSCRSLLSPSIPRKHGCGKSRTPDFHKIWHLVTLLKFAGTSQNNLQNALYEALHATCSIFKFTPLASTVTWLMKVLLNKCKTNCVHFRNSTPNKTLQKLLEDALLRNIRMYSYRDDSPFKKWYRLFPVKTSPLLLWLQTIVASPGISACYLLHTIQNI